MYEVIEMQIDKLPFLVMLTELLAIILQKVCLEFVLVKDHRTTGVAIIMSKNKKEN